MVPEAKREVCDKICKNATMHNKMHEFLQNMPQLREDMTELEAREVMEDYWTEVWTKEREEREGQGWKDKRWSR
jgi:hypothetical protein